MPKVQKIGLKPKYNREHKLVVMQVVDSEGKEVLDSREFDINKLSEAMKNQLLLFGANQLMQTRTSQITDKLEKLPAMDLVWENLLNDVWKSERKVGSPTVRIEVEALARMQNVSIFVIQKTLKDNYDDSQREAIFKSEKLKPFIEEIKLERSAEQPTVDLTDLV